MKSMKNKFITFVKKHKWVQGIFFLMILIGAILMVARICIPSDPILGQNLLYENEEENSIDIAFIGSSSTYRFYDVMAIWNEYKITSMCYFVASMPYDFIVPMIELAQERQDPEVYVIDLRHIITDEYKVKYFGYYESDTQKAAFLNALNLITDPFDKWNVIQTYDYTEDAAYMYEFNVLYNHENFVEGIASLIENGFQIEEMPYKGNYISWSVNDLTDTYADFDEIEEHEDYELTDSTIQRLIELLEYCDENEINAYFTITPYVHSKCFVDQDIRREIGEVVESYGYPYSDYRAEFEDIGLDLTTDFYDKTHANALGAEKYTLYAMEDILEVYDIDTDYEQTVIDSWNEEYAQWARYDMDETQGLYEDIEEEVLETQLEALEAQLEEMEAELEEMEAEADE